MPFSKGFTPWNKGLKTGLVPIWIKRRLAKPLACNHCGESKPLDLANKSGEYKRDLTDWLWLCRPCHAEYDDYVNKSWITRKEGSQTLAK